jgi:hypothetical protein
MIQTSNNKYKYTYIYTYTYTCTYLRVPSILGRYLTYVYCNHVLILVVNETTVEVEEEEEEEVEAEACFMFRDPQSLLHAGRRKHQYVNIIEIGAAATTNCVHVQ